MCRPNLVLLCSFQVALAAAIYPCQNLSQIPTYDGTSATCSTLSPAHGMAAMNWLVSPTSSCKGHVHNVLDKHPTCSIWEESLARKKYCLIIIIEDLYTEEGSCKDPSMDLVHYWQDKGCKVKYVATGIQRTCKGYTRRSFKDMPQVLTLKRFPWSANATTDTVDVLYLLDSVGEGTRALTEFLTLGRWSPVIDQFVVQLDYTCMHARGPGNDQMFPGWHFYHLYYYLSGGKPDYGKFKNVNTVRFPGDEIHHSRCFKDMFFLAGLDTEVKSYISTFTRVQSAATEPTHLATLVSPELSLKINNYLDATTAKGQNLPVYCTLPQNSEAKKDLHEWVVHSMSQHCMVMMGTQASPCKQFHSVDPLTPCMEEVVRNIAEEYAWHRGWCRVQTGITDIPTFPDSEGQAEQLQQYSREQLAAGENSSTGIRLMFMITAYTDAAQVMRLLSKIYSKHHRYVVVVDKSHDVFAADITQRVKILGTNVVVVTPYAVVYLASSATRILAQGMAWMLKEFKDWDYLISLTGTDYPLMSITDIETELSKRNPPMPYLMVWENTTLFQNAYEKYSGSDPNSVLARSALDILREERLRQAFSRRRGNEQYGIPLTCENQKMFMRYSSRKTTQWLFGKDHWKHYPNVFEDPVKSSLPIDGVFRVWYKSDPATTAVYDRESVEYIVKSDEGMKYYHFFKMTLLGSEEHYFISLLRNWERTRKFVGSIEACPVWSTWRFGGITPFDANKFIANLTYPSSKETTVHTRFVTINEMEILKGMRALGVFFARKFTSNANRLMDKIDTEFLTKSRYE